jgi:hypothetical protein
MGEDMKYIIKGALANTLYINLRKTNLMKETIILVPTRIWICFSPNQTLKLSSLQVAHWLQRRILRWKSGKNELIIFKKII